VSDFANERNHHSETPTDQRNHNFNCHFTGLADMGLRL
jgi:hypothetical protein